MYFNNNEVSNEQMIVSWIDTPVTSWQREQVTLWALYIRSKYNLRNLNNVDTIFCKLSGNILYNMSLENFSQILDKDLARIYFDELQIMKCEQNINNNFLRTDVLQAFQSISVEENNGGLDNITSENSYGSDDFNFGNRIGNFFKERNIENLEDASSNSYVTSSSDNDEIDIDETSRYCPRDNKISDKNNGLLNYIMELFPILNTNEKANSNKNQLYSRNSSSETCHKLSDEELLDLENKRVEPKVNKNDEKGQFSSSLIEFDEKSGLPGYLTNLFPQTFRRTSVKKKKDGKSAGPKNQKSPEGKGIKSWQFLLIMLHNPEYCGKIITWIGDENGFFKFLQPEEVARLWGSRNENDSMDYEKFTRALRYYYKYKQEYLIRNKERRVYQFGPKALEWWIDNSEQYKNKTVFS